MIDVWILGGYLGAGKTTTLNALLRSPGMAELNPALIINEFGRIGVDGALVQRRDLARYEINKGSLFCACTRPEILRALEEVSRQPAVAGSGHGVLLIEATGVAEPVDLETLITGDIPGGQFRVRGNICVVDAENFTRIAPFLKPAVEQVRWADTLVINKCDLVDAEELRVLRQVLTDINSTATILETTNGDITLSTLQEGSRKRHGRTDAPYPSSAPSNIFALSFTATGEIQEEQFARVLQNLGDHLLRLKGNIAFSGGGTAFVEVVCGREIRKAPEPDLTAHAGVPTVFTVILWKINAARVRSAFAECGCIG